MNHRLFQLSFLQILPLKAPKNKEGHEDSGEGGADVGDRGPEESPPLVLPLRYFRGGFPPGISHPSSVCQAEIPYFHGFFDQTKVKISTRNTRILYG